MPAPGLLDATPELLYHKLKIHGADGDRTRDLHNAIVALSQLSYCPITIQVNMQIFDVSIRHETDSWRFLSALRQRPAMLVACWLGVAVAVLSAPIRAEAAHANVIELDNQIISPVTQQYIDDAITRSESDGAACLVLQLDTPGGLLDSTRSIVKRIMNATVPVVVYVAPAGSRAGSAGVFITLAAHVAAMAPSTNIGAAHPVAMGDAGPIRKFVRRTTHPGNQPAPREGDSQSHAHGTRDADTPPRADEELVEEEERDPMSDKILNDTVAWVTTIARAQGRNEAWAVKAVKDSFSITDGDALKEHVIDVVAPDLRNLLQQIDGRTVKLIGGPVELHTANVQIIEVPMSKRQEFLTIITHPNIAYLLMMLGTLGLIFEFTHPGIAFPGIAGTICLLLGLYSFQTLRGDYAGMALIVLGIGLLIAEIKIVSHGLLAVGGVVSLTLGSLLLFESPDPGLHVSRQVIASTVGTLTLMILFVVQRALRAQALPVVTGSQALVGQVGIASTAVAPEGTVFLHGELWSATSRRPVKHNAKVRVVEVRGLQLVVEPLE